MLYTRHLRVGRTTFFSETFFNSSTESHFSQYKTNHSEAPGNAGESREHYAKKSFENEYNLEELERHKIMLLERGNKYTAFNQDHHQIVYLHSFQYKYIYTASKQIVSGSRLSSTTHRRCNTSIVRDIKKTHCSMLTGNRLPCREAGSRFQTLLKHSWP